MNYICTVIDATTTECISNASSSPMYINGFSYDGLLIGLYLTLIFCILFFRMIYESTIGVKQKPKHYE